MRPNVSRMPAGRQSSTALVAVLLALVPIAGCGGEEEPSGAAPTGAFDAERAFTDLREQVELGPRPAGSAASIELTEMLAAKLEEAGARDVTIQRPWRNVVGVLPGSEPGYVVIGAHHDTKDGIPGLVGANDGASGVAVVLELARSLPKPLPGPSIAIALFDAEEARGDRLFAEDGKRGSRQYVALAESAALRALRRSTRSGRWSSSTWSATATSRCPTRPTRPAGSGRSSAMSTLRPSAARGRRSTMTTLIPRARDPGRRPDRLLLRAGGTPGAYWHTDEDTLDKVCPESLDAVGEAAVEVLPTIGAAPAR